MNGSSIWAIFALVVATAVAVFTLSTEKKEREINPPRLRRWRKPILYCLTGAALIVGVGQIFRADREAHDAGQEARQANAALKDALAKLGESTTKIADMTSLNTQLQDKLLKQSDTITALSKQNIAAVTGGDSFCYVIATPTGNEFLLNVVTNGSSPLHEVFFDMADLDTLREITRKPSFTWQDIQNATTSYPAIPFLASSSTRSLGKIPTGASDKRNLHFNFFSMNGVWAENLSLRLVKGQWQQAIKVTKELKGNRQKTLYSYVSDDYPRIDGKVDW